MDSVVGALCILYLSELSVDWIKHMSICNNLAYSPGYYLGKLMFFAREEHKNLQSMHFFQDHSGVLSRSLCHLLTIFNKI